MSKYVYKTKGTCSKSITIELDGKTIKSAEFEGGCPGNTLGISQIVRGMDVDHVIERFEGVPCGQRGTSCPDQLAKALKEAYAVEVPA